MNIGLRPSYLQQNQNPDASTSPLRRTGANAYSGRKTACPLRSAIGPSLSGLELNCGPGERCRLEADRLARSMASHARGLSSRRAGLRSLTETIDTTTSRRHARVSRIAAWRSRARQLIRDAATKATGVGGELAPASAIRPPYAKRRPKWSKSDTASLEPYCATLELALPKRPPLRRPARDALPTCPAGRQVQSWNARPCVTNCRFVGDFTQCPEAVRHVPCQRICWGPYPIFAAIGASVWSLCKIPSRLFFECIFEPIAIRSEFWRFHL